MEILHEILTSLKKLENADNYKVIIDGKTYTIQDALKSEYINREVFMLDFDEYYETITLTTKKEA